MRAALRWLVSSITGSMLLRRIVEVVLDVIKDFISERKGGPQQHAQ